MPSLSEISALNERIFEDLNTPGREKQAVDAINDFTRTRMREDGFYRRIMPFIEVSNDQLDRALDTDMPIKIVDKEPNSPAAVTLPFGSLPTSFYILGSRYRITFCRVVGPRFQKDVDELRTYHMDIRQVLSDNAMKDMLATEDEAFIEAVNAAMLGPDIPVPHNGNVVQWETINGGITRETFMEALKIMPRGPSRLEAHTALINNLTIKEVMKWGRDEMGGDFSQDVIKNGWSVADFNGLTLIITIKHGLVPTDSMFMFADPAYIGKACTLEDVVMYIKREAFMIEFFPYQTLGGAIGHTGGLARADFA